MCIHYRALLTTSSEIISPIGYNSGPRPATGPALRSDNEQSDFLWSSCYQSMPIFTCRTPPSSVLIAKIMHRLPMAVVRSSRHMHVRGAGPYLAATLLSLRLSLACICGLKNTRYSWWTWISLFSCSSLNQRCKRDSSLRHERARLFVRPVAMLHKY